MLVYIRDRILQMRLQRDEKEIKILFLIIGVIAFLLILLITSLIFLFIKNKEDSIPVVAQSPILSISPSPTVLPLSPTLLPTPVATIQPTIAQTVLVQEPAVKDYFIPLGSGTNNSTDWADVVGVAARMDFGQYKNIKEIRFESSVNLPASGQFVNIRIYNQTDKHPVWYSEVATTGSATSYLVSQPLAYDKGEKLYQVQMKNQLQAPANLVQSRLHIILK